MSPRVDSWVALSPNTFDSRIGPKLEIVARTGTPSPPVPSDRNSTGKAVGVQSSPVSEALAAILSFGTPGRDRPDRSPLTSAIITDTPAADSCSAITCRDFVFPVPVDHGQRDANLRGGICGAVDDHTPEVEGLPLDGVAGGDLLSRGGCRFCTHRSMTLSVLIAPSSHHDTTENRGRRRELCRAGPTVERCARRTGLDRLRDDGPRLGQGPTDRDRGAGHRR